MKYAILYQMNVHKNINIFQYDYCRSSAQVWSAEWFPKGSYGGIVSKEKKGIAFWREGMMIQKWTMNAVYVLQKLIDE